MSSAGLPPRALRAAPLVLAAALALAFTLVSAVNGLRRLAPSDPWEAGHVVDAWRWAEGRPLPIHGYYPTQLPDSVRAEIEGAEHVVLVRRDLPHDSLLSAEALVALGFRVTWTAPGGGYARMSRSRSEAGAR